jgi:hypothetical protein
MLVRIGVSFLVAALAVALAAGTAGARGNSDNAKLCQHGGWEHLQTADGQGFRNPGDCVAYAAHGGTLTSAPSLQEQWQTACEGDGGTFHLTASGWLCSGNTLLSQDAYEVMAAICVTAGGTSDDSYIHYDSACDFP